MRSTSVTKHRYPFITALAFPLLIAIVFYLAMRNPLLTGMAMKVPGNEKVDLTEQTIQSQFLYQSDAMLSLKISYPELKLSSDESIRKKINDYYSNSAKKFYNQAYSLAESAIADYKNAVKSGYRFIPYDAVLQYSVTFNGNCYLSTYFDQYEYAGGAHGCTIRTSENWDLQSGRRLKLKDFFNRRKDSRKLILDEILLLADQQMLKDPIYFEDYKELIVKNFNPNSFFLTPNGICVFYQQYDIGPYSSGIIVFEIPYKSLGIQKPTCAAENRKT